MATTDPALQSRSRSANRTVNEFSIQVATVNGSGSQTANLILIRSLFQMGIPVSGKNLFPSNIAGLRSDLTFYPVPFDKLVAAVCPDAKLRRLVRNMIYDGVVSYLLDIDLEEMEKALDKQLGRKPKALALNVGALKAGFDYAQAHFESKAAFRAERMNANEGKLLIEGNAAAAIGCLMAG